MARAIWPIKPGDKFNRLEAICFVRISDRSVKYWEFKCDCGKSHVTVAAQVKSGHIKSCGCLFREKIEAPRRGKHKMIKSPEYRTWTAMLRRCRHGGQNPRHGGRGISVCARWENDFAAFYADMGAKPSLLHSLDRIDNDGNYELADCRWATPQQQARNRHNSIFVNVDGADVSLSEAAKMLGVDYRTLYWRLKRNKPLTKIAA